MITNMSEVSNDNFGRRLALFRRDKGLTQYQFALALGLRRHRAIQQIEAGKCLPSAKTQIALAEIFGITVCEPKESTFSSPEYKASTKIESFGLLLLIEISRRKKIIHQAFLELEKNPGCTCYDINKLKKHERRLTAISKYICDTIRYFAKLEKLNDNLQF